MHNLNGLYTKLRRAHDDLEVQSKEQNYKQKSSLFANNLALTILLLFIALLFILRLLMKITVVGTGYVGLSNAMLLAQHNEVIALDIDEQKIALLNNKQSPIVDDYISEYLQRNDLNFTATINKNQAYTDADFIIIAVKFK